MAADLIDAIGEGINNALAITGSSAPLSVPAPPRAYAPDQGIQRGQVAHTGQEELPGQVTQTDNGALHEGVTDTENAVSQMQVTEP